MSNNLKTFDDLKEGDFLYYKKTNRTYIIFIKKSEYIIAYDNMTKLKLERLAYEKNEKDFEIRDKL